MVDRYFDEENGGFFDIEADEASVGHMQVREKQLPENMTAVQGFLKLHQATRNEDYKQLCEATLSAFASVFREHGEFAADFGLTVDLFTNPMVEVTVEGDPESSRQPSAAGSGGPARQPEPRNQDGSRRWAGPGPRVSGHPLPARR